MKNILITLVGIGMIVALVIFGESKTVVENTALETQVIEKEVVKEKDVLEKARADLERVNAELDAEEAALLQEREVLDARLEEIRELRSSF